MRSSVGHGGVPVTESEEQVSDVNTPVLAEVPPMGAGLP